jgi:hypothetical protein
MSSYLNPRGPEYPPPRPWEFLAPAIDWLAGCREKYLAFGSGVTAAGLVWLRTVKSGARHRSPTNGLHCGIERGSC